MIADDFSDFTSSYHREGILCGRCEDGYSLAINSLYYGVPFVSKPRYKLLSR